MESRKGKYRRYSGCLSARQGCCKGSSFYLANKLIKIKSPFKQDLLSGESVKLIRSSTPANIDINQNIADDVAPILGNATQINQLLINLCTNATDAMINTGGAITICLNNEIIDEKVANSHASLSPGRYVKLMVSDTGHGIDKHTLDRIFEPYFTTKAIGKGTGIGLAVVHGIVEKHSGHYLG